MWPTWAGVGGWGGGLSVRTHLNWNPALLCVPHHMVEVIKFILYLNVNLWTTTLQFQEQH